MLRNLIRAALKDYSLYRIYQRECTDERHSSVPVATDSLCWPDKRHWCFVPDLDKERLRDSSANELRQFSNYGADGSLFAITDDGAIACACWYALAPHSAHSGYWPLADGEAMLEQIVTAPTARGQGIATALIAASADEMAARGFHRLFARIWHNHGASCRAFEKAGWRARELIVEVPLPRLSKVFRWRRGTESLLGRPHLIEPY